MPLLVFWKVDFFKVGAVESCGKTYRQLFDPQHIKSPTVELFRFKRPSWNCQSNTEAGWPQRRRGVYPAVDYRIDPDGCAE